MRTTLATGAEAQTGQAEWVSGAQRPRCRGSWPCAASTPARRPRQMAPRHGPSGRNRRRGWHRPIAPDRQLPFLQARDGGTRRLRQGAGLECRQDMPQGLAPYRSALPDLSAERRHAMRATALQLFGVRQGHVAHQRQRRVLGARQGGKKPQVVAQGVAGGEAVETRGTYLKLIALRQTQKRWLAGRRRDFSGPDDACRHFAPLLTLRYQAG